MAEGGIEMTDADRDAEELERGRRAGARGGSTSGARRRAGHLGAMSGAGGMRYLEYSTGGGPAKYKGGGLNAAKKLGLK